MDKWKIIEELLPHVRFSGHHVIYEIFERVLVNLRALVACIACASVSWAFNTVKSRKGAYLLLLFLWKPYYDTKKILLRT